MSEFFFDEQGDRRMEQQNREHWKALAELIAQAIRQDRLPHTLDVLDIGCHAGGLLLQLFERLRANNKHEIARVAGVEPIADVRRRAAECFGEAQFFPTLQDVPDQYAHLVVSHESLYLVPDLAEWVRQLKRVLRPKGRAFIALGCHGENTAWLRWRVPLVKLYGHHSYVHHPMEILQAGADAGFAMELHRLYPQPKQSMRYSPPEDGWGEFISAQEMLEHARQKYVFVFSLRE
ncbi:MAG: methyltransferase domain-containing protein [bacterium]|nr:methyltransferase domain-containing protein [bacterium]